MSEAESKPEEEREAPTLFDDAQTAVNLLVGVAGDLATSGAFEAAGRVMAGAKIITVLSSELKKAQDAAK